MASITTRIEGFERAIAVVTGDLSPEKIAPLLARHAREALDEAVRGGEGSKVYDVFVNGRRGASEDSVVPPGPIVYVFVQWPTIIQTALSELRKRAPVLTGRYQNSFIVLANQKIVTDYESIPGDAEVVILNVQPYTRKLESGATLNKARQKRRSSGHFDRSRVALSRQLSGLARVETQFLNVAAGLHAGVPYILKGQAPRLAKTDRRSSAFRAGRHFLSVRPDRRPGMPITYPSLILNLER